jgi:hypothetical protein
MSNFLLKDPDCVLIHIHKTGGTSMRKGVWVNRASKPVFGYIPDEWSHLFKFAFVRHPLDRLVSAWKMFTDGTETFSAGKQGRDMTIEDALDILEDDSIIYDERRKTLPERLRHHAIPQTHPYNCLQYADFVGRFERIDEDFAKVAEKLGMTATLPKMHSTSHQEWQHYIKGEALERAAAYYKKDLEELNYSI